MSGGARTAWRYIAAAAVAVAAFAVGTAFAGSPGTKLCIPETASKPTLTPNAAGECKPKGKVQYKLADLGEEGPPGINGTSIVARARSTEPIETSEKVIASVPFGSPVSWTQFSGELNEVRGYISYSPHTCNMTVYEPHFWWSVLIDGIQVEEGGSGAAYTSGATVPIHGWIWEPGSTREDSLEVRVSQRCNNEIGHWRVEDVKLDVISVR
jgi:hypothetical protein